MYKLAMTEKTLQGYLDKLPISYYFKAKLKVKISKSNASFINLVDKTIYISPTFLSGIKYNHKPTEYEVENAVRCTLYHEVSHAILTPSNLNQFCERRSDKDIINVFEDERIETVLDGFYHRVDFKSFIKTINNFDDRLLYEPTPSEDYLYYCVVRYNEVPYDIKTILPDGADKLLKLKKFLIDKYSNCSGYNVTKGKIRRESKFLNAFTGAVNILEEYIKDIRSLYNACSNVFRNFIEEQERKAVTPPPLSAKGKDKDDEEGNQNANNKEEKENKKYEEPEKQKENPIETYIIKPEMDEIARVEEEKEDEEQDREEELNTPNPGGVNEIKDRIQEIITYFIEDEEQRFKNDFYFKARKIIKMYLAKDKNNGGSTASYNGKLSARLFTRDNNETYKWFIHANGNQLKRGCKLHLNIFCDTSGSFSGNEKRVNNMLAALEKIEKEMSNIFEFDVYVVDWSMRKLPKYSRRIKVGNANTVFSKEWEKVITKAQDKDNDTVNIVLFDGCIFPNGYSKKDLGSYLRCFNKNNFIFIIEESNAPTFRRVCKHCRKIISEKDSWVYPEELENNVLKVLNSYVQGI